MTIDGKITVGKEKNSRYLIELLSQEFLREIHKFRAQNDAILVGANTIRIDNPSLTNRFFEGNNPKRVIISESLNFTFNETIFTDNNETIVVTKEKQRNTSKAHKIEEKGKKCLFIEEDKFNVCNIISLLEEKENIKTLIVEGGGQINWNFNEKKLFNELYIYVIPIIVGGKNTVTLVDGSGDENLLNFYNLIDVNQQGNCVRLHYKRR